MLQARVPFGGLQRSCKCLTTLAYRPFSSTPLRRQETAADPADLDDDLSMAPPPVRDKRAIQLRSYTPRTPGLRHLRRPINDHLWKGRPVHELTFPKKGHGKGGRNYTGRVTVRHRGGGHKRRIRIVDYERNEPGPHVVQRIEHDPGRTAHIALLKSKLTKKLSYVLAAEGMREGDIVQSYRAGIPDDLWEAMGGGIDPGVLAAKTARRGNCLPLHMVPIGSMIFNIGLHKGKGGQLCRGAGTYGILMTKAGEAPPPWEEVKPKEENATAESKDSKEPTEAEDTSSEAAKDAKLDAEVEAEIRSDADAAGEKTVMSELEWKRLKKLSEHVAVRLQSGEVRLIHKDCCATIGVASNVNKKYAQLGKAGRKRWLNIRPTVRGVAMNAKDHPHGGGRGKSKGGVHPKSPWGLPVCPFHLSSAVYHSVAVTLLTQWYRPNPDTRQESRRTSTEMSLPRESATKESVAEDTISGLTSCCPFSCCTVEELMIELLLLTFFGERVLYIPVLKGNLICYYITTLIFLPHQTLSRLRSYSCL
ncbi:hypothetical protein H105_01712 [Trichophyton soudanense CBS 452.61]|uniref:Large ribosomal subunit protein uL2m n=1 Tax=Trichophyton soudanense CBS 452.61 TaxID=1215331 RepID=A0A022Y2A4_TRISD|nr:hypothetical protein H105_01712 [Trichophyton soudanense CBS 452.61]